MMLDQGPTVLFAIAAAHLVSVHYTACPLFVSLHV